MTAGPEFQVRPLARFPTGGRFSSFDERRIEGDKTSRYGLGAFMATGSCWPGGPQPSGHGSIRSPRNRFGESGLFLLTTRLIVDWRQPIHTMFNSEHPCARLCPAPNSPEVSCSSGNV